MPLKLENLDFRYENSRIKVIANRNYPQMKLAGISVGPFQEGNEYDVYNWIGEELAEAGIVHFREEDNLDATKLYKVQWKERVQVAGQISELPEDFYPKIRRYLKELKQDFARQPEKIQTYQRTKQLADDIVNSRLKKIVALSSAPIQGEQILGKLTVEERLIYMQLAKIVSEWRAHILHHET
ncbi:MAG: DNA replication complex GINS family protein [Candidatus Bathyarchaeota archaeon]|nr:DNA replication complex GINS family protein [Candidatus Bathyarchaeota archaeon]